MQASLNTSNIAPTFFRAPLAQRYDQNIVIKNVPGSNATRTSDFSKLCAY